jgi:hypothetical protein
MIISAFLELRFRERKPVSGGLQRMREVQRIRGERVFFLGWGMGEMLHAP